MEFERLGDYLAKCNSTTDRVVVPTDFIGVCADAFLNNQNITEVVLPENVIYCVSLDSCLASNSLKTLTIHNSWFSGILTSSKLPSLRRVEILDTDIQRLSSIRAMSLMTQIANLPPSVEVFFPHCNLYACNRDDCLDIRLCARFLNSKWLYNEDEQKGYMEYIKFHEYAILRYFIEKEEIESLRAFLPTVEPDAISRNLELLQELGDTEITAIALDILGKSGAPAASGSAFDLSFLDDIISDPLAEPEEKEKAKTTVFAEDLETDFEIRGIEGSCVVVGAYLGESTDCFIIPDEIGGYAVEGVGAPTKQPVVSPIAIAVGKNVKALFRHALAFYVKTNMLLLTQNVSFIDETAINRAANVTIYCPTGCYAYNWAQNNGFRTKSPAEFLSDLKSQGATDV